MRFQHRGRCPRSVGAASLGARAAAATVIAGGLAAGGYGIASAATGPGGDRIPRPGPRRRPVLPSPRPAAAAPVVRLPRGSQAASGGEATSAKAAR